jgi:hypothetical protein
MLKSLALQVSSTFYRSKVLGALMDRRDIHMEVPADQYKDLFSKELGRSSKELLAMLKGPGAYR